MIKNSKFKELIENGKVRSRKLKDVNGLDMHFYESGKNKKNPLILLLHGFPELSYSWRDIIHPLSKAGFYVVAPDQRGYGKTMGGDNQFKSRFRSNNMINLSLDITFLKV